MTNLFKRFFTHKSKFLLIILCLLGLAFSYSCTCRNPNNPDGGGGSTPPPPQSETFSASLSTKDAIFRLKSSGDLGKTATIKFASTFGFNVNISEVTDDNNNVSKDDVVYNSETGELNIEGNSLTSLKNLASTDKPAENPIKVVFEVSATNSSLLNNKINFTNDISIYKAQKLDDNKVQTLISELGETLSFEFADATIKDGLISVKEAGNHDEEVTTDSFVTTLNTRIAIRKGVGKLKELKELDFIKVEVPNGGKKATFHYKLILEDNYETIYDNEKTPLRIELTIDSGGGSWTDNSTKQ